MKRETMHRNNKSALPLLATTANEHRCQRQRATVMTSSPTERPKDTRTGQPQRPISTSTPWRPAYVHRKSATCFMVLVLLDSLKSARRKKKYANQLRRYTNTRYTITLQTMHCSLTWSPGGITKEIMLVPFLLRHIIRWPIAAAAAAAVGTEAADKKREKETVSI